jgi:hypothetical protein
MDSPLYSLLATASFHRWCVRRNCSTCGSNQYRTEIKRLASDDGAPLAEALRSIAPIRLVTCRDWEDGLVIAFDSLPTAQQGESVLRSWLAQAGQSPRFDDVVLFRILRFTSRYAGIRELWIDAAIPDAVRRKDESLLETLLLVLGRSASKHEDLVRAASEIAVGSAQMRRVLRNTVGTKPA